MKNDSALYNILLSLVLSLGICACASRTQPTAPADLVSKAAVSKPAPVPVSPIYSEVGADWEQLQSAANYVASVITGSIDARMAKKKPEKILSCDPKTTEVNVWIMRLKSLIDEVAEQERVVYFSLSPTERTANAKWLNCEASCLCGDYAELIAGADAGRLTEEDRQFQKMLMEKHMAQSSEKLKQCANSVTWFCGSKLHNWLKANR